MTSNRRYVLVTGGLLGALTAGVLWSPLALGAPSRPGAQTVAPAVTEATTAPGSVYNWSARAGVDFRAWVPAGREVVNGVYVNFNCSGCDSRDEATDEAAQEFARSLGFAIVGTRFDRANETGHSADLLMALAQFAAMSGHSELAHAPVAAMGASLGGYNAMQFAVDYPSRTLAYVSTSSNRLVDSQHSPGLLKVPGLFAAGSNETWIRTRPAEVQDLRRRGALVAFYWGWGFDHGYVWDPAMGWNFLSDVIRKRFPAGSDPRNGPLDLIELPAASGWLADPAGLELVPGGTTPLFPAPFTPISPYGSYVGDRSSAMWLPSPRLAYMYRGLASWEHPVWYPAGMPYWWRATTYNSPPLSSGWTVLKRGQSVDVTAQFEGDTPAAVRFFDGAKLLTTVATPPYRIRWVAKGMGIHAITVVGDYADGTSRSGAIAPVIVRGSPSEGQVK